MIYPYCAMNVMFHEHSMHMDQLLIRYSSYSNEVLFFEAVYGVTLNIRNCLCTCLIYHLYCGISRLSPIRIL
jgi:hypothetical protein